jgi:hypothetical protein
VPEGLIRQNLVEIKSIGVDVLEATPTAHRAAEAIDWGHRAST